MIKEWIAKIVGNKIKKELNLQEGIVETKRWFQSKAVWTAIIGGVLAIVQGVSTALGKPIVIPNWILELLAAVGVYSLRTGDKPIA